MIENMVIKPLEPKDKVIVNKVISRVINFNPINVYQNLENCLLSEDVFPRHGLNPYKRKNNILMRDSFTIKKDGLCDCGCGKKLIGKQRRWASEDCSRFAYLVTNVINGDSDTIRNVLRNYFDNWACVDCGVMDIYKEQSNGVVVDSIHVDHILAVQNGGGGCWLSNYQLLCEGCHKEKTKIDNKYGKTRNI